MKPSTDASLKTPPTSKEVARRAGVSRTTVSFVLNNVRDQGISETTRARVLQAASEIGYEPNAAARTLAGGMTGTVALVIPKAAHLYVDAFLGQFAASINQECHRHGLKMLIESSDEEGREPGGFVDLVRSRSIDGLIVINPSVIGGAHLQRIAEAGIPMVVLGAGMLDVRYHTAGNETSAAAKMATRYLIDLGHRSIAFVNFARPEYLAVNARERGWREAMAERGLAIDPAWVAYADISAASGYIATQELLTRGMTFTALLAGNDTIAFGAMKALKETGLRVPQDIAVVGYDDIPMAAFASPPLTTVRSDSIGLGRDAMDMLVALLRGAVYSAAHRHQQPVELIIRESCGAYLRNAAAPVATS